MESSSQTTQRKNLPGRNSRTFASVRHNHLLGVDGLETPTYDASEEDNDETMDDNASAVSVPAPLHAHSRTVPSSPLAARLNRAKASRSHPAVPELESDEGVDSPTYDGDIESSTTTVAPSNRGLSAAAVFAASISNNSNSNSNSNSGSYSPPSGNSSIPTPPKLTPRMMEKALPTIVAEDVDKTPGGAEGDFSSTSGLTEEDIQTFVRSAVMGEMGRAYKINPPPEGRPIRIYADGVYDLFHFGHALQLRQAKLAFPSVHLLVGVCSDTLVQQHKAPTVMTHAERCESVRHCKWVDEVVEDAPWIVDDALIEKYRIDYVAHDEEPYKSAEYDDVYSHVKELGKFVPTRRTPGVSTSELLERIVSQYRKGRLDRKLEKMGHSELMAEGSDYDDNRPRAPGKGKAKEGS